MSNPRYKESIIITLHDAIHKYTSNWRSYDQRLGVGKFNFTLNLQGKTTGLKRAKDYNRFLINLNHLLSSPTDSYRRQQEHAPILAYVVLFDIARLDGERLGNSETLRNYLIDALCAHFDVTEEEKNEKLKEADAKSMSMLGHASYAERVQGLVELLWQKMDEKGYTGIAEKAFSETNIEFLIALKEKDNLLKNK